MQTILVWLLISTSYGSLSHSGTTTVIDRFKSEAQCEHVRKNLPMQGSISARCIQAEILVPSK